MNTDEIAQIVEKLNEAGLQTSLAKHLAAFGLQLKPINNVIAIMGMGALQAFEGDESMIATEAVKSGVLLGLQLGAMRLDPLTDIEDIPPDQTQCDCIVCRTRRALLESEDENENE